MPITVNGISCILAGGVRETADATGTGTYNLRGARTVDGITYRTVVAGIGSGNRSTFTARLGSSFETFIGTVTAGTPAQLTRDQILESSNSNNAVNWGVSDTLDLILDAAAAAFHSLQAQFRPTGLPAMFVDSRARQTAAGATNYGFTSIVSDVRQITVTLDSWRSGTAGNPSALLIQLGNSGGYVGAGYASRCAGINSVLGSGYIQSTAGFVITAGSSQLANYSGSAIISRHGSGNDRWVCQACIMEDTSMLYAAGAVAISNIDRVRIIAANGTDTFTGGGAIGCDIFYGTT